ncbi:DUF802 domain-containing protein [Massilia sp. H-1]|nr:DUF802 domain-containing protein [Massilia sp. H-1]
MHERTAWHLYSNSSMAWPIASSVATASVAQTWNTALDGQMQVNRSLASDMARSLDAFSASFDERAAQHAGRNSRRCVCLGLQA